MEDDIVEYEELKSKIDENKKSKSIMKFAPSAYVTPHSIKLCSNSRLEEESELGIRPNYETPEDLRSNPLYSGNDSVSNLLHSGDYISSLLQNIMQDNEEDDEQA